MAKDDIVFTGSIKVDTEQAKKDVENLAKQVESVFAKTGALMTQTLKSNDFGFSQYANNYLSGLRKLQTIQNTFARTPDLDIPKGAKKKVRDEIKAKNAAFHAGVARSAGSLAQLRNLSRHLVGLSEFDTVFGGVDELRNAVAAGKVEPEQGLGRYNVLQHFMNRGLGWLYSGHRFFPDIFDDSVLENAEQKRDANRITGAEIRSNLRFSQKREYYGNSAQRARNWLWYKDGKRLQLLNEIYGLGISPTTTRAPVEKYLDSVALFGEQSWMEAGLQAANIRRNLASGTLTAQEAKASREKYFSLMNKMIKGYEKAYPDQHEIAISLRRLRNEVSGIQPSGGDGGTTLWGSILAGSALARLARPVLHAAIETIDTVVETYGEEKVKRNAYYSEHAALQRQKAYAGLIGAAVGTVGGAWIGGTLAGSAGAAATAAAGGVGAVPSAIAGITAGGTIGGYLVKKVAQMFPSWWSKEYESDIRSSTEIASMARNHALFGYGYNTYFAHGLTEQGIANGESAMSGLADRSMNMRARMMLGQVNEQEMLYMSMMPNYYAALMGGVTGPELLNIYHHDLQNIGDPSMKYLVGHAIGNTEAFAAANSRYFSSFYNANYNASALYKSRTDPLEASFMYARQNMALETLSLEDKEIQDTYRRANPTITVVVNIDGEEIKRATQKDEVYMDDLQFYTVGA